MGLLHRKLTFSKDPEGVQHFPGEGGPTFSRGGGSNFFKGGGGSPNANFNRNHITCDFSGGFGSLSPFGSVHITLKQNFSIHFPFDISQLPCPWTYIIHWICCTPAQ